MVMERLGATKSHPQNQGELQQFVINRTIADFQAVGIVDPGPKEPTQRRTSNRSEIPVPTELNLNSEW